MDRRKRAARRQAAAQRNAENAPPAQQRPDDAAADRGSGLFGKVNAAFQDAIQAGRGDDAPGSEIVMDHRAQTVPAPDELTLRRSKSVRTERMIVPEGVTIEGAMTSNSDTEIYGTIDGNVTVNSRLYLGPTAQITGSVRATLCRVESEVKGNVECTEDLELGPEGILRNDAIAGKKMIIGGEVHGNVTCGGLIHVLSTAKITGNIRARMVSLEEGAVFNGTCKTVRDQPTSGGS